MKKFILKLRNRILTLWLMSLALASCSSTRSMPVVQSSDTLMLFRQGYCEQMRGERLEVRDKDSVIIRERTVHDTVYITKEVYRDRLEARGERLKAVKTDTVVVTEWREKVIEPPPERYIPPFYKRCTWALWGLVALGIVCLLLRWRLGV